MSGSATIDKKTPVLVGEICYDAGHDSYTYNWNYVTIADTLTQPDPDDDTVKNAYIVPPKWKRGQEVLRASGSADVQLALIAGNIGRFGTADQDFLVEQTPGVAKGVLNAPIYIAGSGKSSDVTGTPTDADSTRGTRSSPYASLKYALEKVCDDGDVDHCLAVTDPYLTVGLLADLADLQLEELAAYCGAKCLVIFKLHFNNYLLLKSFSYVPAHPAVYMKSEAVHASLYHQSYFLRPSLAMRVLYLSRSFSFR